VVDEETDLLNELDQYKQRLQETEEEIASYQAKIHLLRNQSHEFRTLASVLNNIYLLLETPLTPEQREYAEIIRDCKDGLITLINEFFDFLRIEAGVWELCYEPFNLHECIENRVKWASKKPNENDVILSYHIDADVPDTVIGDIIVTNGIVSLLVNNALRYTAKGSILISLATIGSKKSNTSVYDFCLTVNDTGIKLEPESIECIQEFFSQKGSNLLPYEKVSPREDPFELTLMKWYADLIDGTLWVEAKPEENATQFSLSFQYEVVNNVQQ
jgi:signal transduction histidine kinase